jgi:hypothetical protein
VIQRILGDHFTGCCQRDLVARADDECRQLAEFAEAVAERIDLMAAGDRQQVGPIGTIGLVGTLDRGSSVRGTADHRRGQHPSDTALCDQNL